MSNLFLYFNMLECHKIALFNLFFNGSSQQYGAHIAKG